MIIKTNFTNTYGWSSQQYPYQAADAAAGCEALALAIEKAGSVDPAAVRTAFERADEKKSHPGAAALLREFEEFLL